MQEVLTPIHKLDEQFTTDEPFLAMTSSPEMVELDAAGDSAIEAHERMVAMVSLFNMAGNLSRSTNPEHQAVGRGVIGTIAVTETIAQTQAYNNFITLQNEIRGREAEMALYDPFTGELKSVKKKKSPLASANL